MKSSFQVILIGVSVAAFIGAILVFAGIINIGSSKSSTAVTGYVSVWGVYPNEVMQTYIDSINIENKDLTVSYEYKAPESMAQALTSALADGQQPDIVITNSEQFFTIKNRVYVIPFATFPERTYRDTYVDGASVFLSKEGVLAMPLLVDPLVVFYNKDLLAGQNYVVPPTTWTGLVQSLPKFIKKDARGVITQTAIALGEPANVTLFKEILSALFLQTGNSIVGTNSSSGGYESKLLSTDEAGVEAPTVQALTFFTNFSNPTSELYSWTRTLPNSLDMFLSGRSAFYIGKASELFAIQTKNPNLNFDVTAMFQPDDAIRSVTYGSFSSLAIMKASKNFSAAYIVAGQLTSPAFIEYLSKASSLPPVRRDLLLTQQTNPYVQVFFKAALSAFAWVDPSPVATRNIFRDMIQGVSSGRVNAAQAIYEASRDLQSAVR